MTSQKKVFFLDGAGQDIHIARQSWSKTSRIQINSYPPEHLRRSVRQQGNKRNRVTEIDVPRSSKQSFFRLEGQIWAFKFNGVNIEALVSWIQQYHPILAPTKHDSLIYKLDPTVDLVRATFPKSGLIELITPDQGSDPSHHGAPENIAAFPGHKVIIVGDTHHRSNALGATISYLQQEKWDIVLIAHQPAHLNLFRACLDHSNVMLCQPWLDKSHLVDGEIDRSILMRADKGIYLRHSESHLHPKRNRLAEAINGAGVNKREASWTYQIQVKERTQGYMQWLHELEGEFGAIGCCLSNNISMNQIFPMLAGSLLISEPFFNQWGYGRTLIDGQHYLRFDSFEQLQELVSLANMKPDIVADIAGRGRRECLKRFSLRADSNRWILESSLESAITTLSQETIWMEGSDHQLSDSESRKEFKNKCQLEIPVICMIQELEIQGRPSIVIQEGFSKIFGQTITSCMTKASIHHTYSTRIATTYKDSVVFWARAPMMHELIEIIASHSPRHLFVDLDINSRLGEKLCQAADLSKITKTNRYPRKVSKVTRKDLGLDDYGYTWNIPSAATIYLY